MLRHFAVTVLSALVLAGILSGCGNWQGCTENNKCVTTVPTLPKGPLATSTTPFDAAEKALEKAGYTTPTPLGESSIRKWQKDDTTVTIDRNTDGSTTTVKSPEGTVTCDDIGANPAGFDPIAFVQEMHKLGHDRLLKEKKDLCHT